MEWKIGTVILAILPEIFLFVLAAVILTVDLVLAKVHKHLLGWIAFAGLLLSAVFCLMFAPDLETTSEVIWGGMIKADAASYVFSILMLCGAAVTVLFVLRDEELGARGEFYVLLLISAAGLCLMASAADMILLFLAVETASVPLYVLAGFQKKNPRSIEAGIKYMLFGATASAIMLYGFSLLYGLTGTTQLYDLAAEFRYEAVSQAPLIAGLLLVVAGFAFKISAVPFHFWAPDVYEGAPTPVAGFLSTASKAAGFAMLLRFVLAVFPELSSVATIVLSVLAVASMLVGNILAISQKNIKRLLAYSSIAQAGYMLIGIAAPSVLGISGTIYYLMAYLVTNLVAFGIIQVTANEVGSDDLMAFRGLSRRSPALALLMLVAILSLAGIPPFAGFVGKLLVFTAAIKQDMTWLAFVGILNAIVGLYYYLNVLKIIYLYRSEGDEAPMRISWNWSVAFAICISGIVLLGTLIAPWYQFASKAAVSLLGY